MTKLFPIAILVAACMYVPVLLPAQDSLHLPDKIVSFPTSFLNKISNKTSQLEEKIIAKSEKAL